ncbi:MAG: nucleotide sugar dehydrogenase [Chloroflexota bacterium]
MMKITILGSGVVGQATGRGFLSKGHDVTFLDINTILVHQLQREGLQAYELTADLSTLESDLIMVCIGTPACETDREINLNYIKAGMKTVADLLGNQRGWPVVVIRSTVPPTTTELILIPLIERYSGLTAGRDFGVCMNPEFLRAKSATEDFAHPWATVVGELDTASGDVLASLYESFGGELYRTPLAEAEFIKYINNLRNALVISFSNEMWQFGQTLNINSNLALNIATTTAESAWNAKYGSTGGFPYGGTCLPKDTNALHLFAKQQGIDLPLLASVIAVNDEMERLANKDVIPQSQIAGHNWQPSPALQNSLPHYTDDLSRPYLSVFKTTLEKPKLGAVS